MNQSMQNSPEQIEDQTPSPTRRERVGRQLMMLGMATLLAHFALLLARIDDMIALPLGSALAIAGVLVTPRGARSRSDWVALVFAGLTLVMSMLTVWLKMT